jgi:hypothetical protein
VAAVRALVLCEACVELWIGGAAEAVPFPFTRQRFGVGFSCGRVNSGFLALLGMTIC